MPDTSADRPLVIKKYPNRRYYDTSRSRHLTLDEIRQLVEAGREVQVVESKEGQDITSRVLAQILLEQDNCKVDLFPKSLLHLMIRSSDSLVQEFMEVHFSQAFEWFMQVNRSMDQQLRRAMGLAGGPSAATASPSWLDLMRAWSAQGDGSQAPPNNEPAAAPPDVEALHGRLDRLSRRMEDLHTKLAASGQP